MLIYRRQCPRRRQRDAGPDWLYYHRIEMGIGPIDDDLSRCACIDYSACFNETSIIARTINRQEGEFSQFKCLLFTHRTFIYLFIYTLFITIFFNLNNFQIAWAFHLTIVSLNHNVNYPLQRNATNRTVCNV